MEQIFTVTLPDIGEGVVEGEVIRWLKNVGETLQQDEPVVQVMTDKATVELPAPYPGVLQKQYVETGQKAIKDEPLYDIFLEGEPLPKKVLATPKTRGVAKELGVDIQKVKGSGKEGRVEVRDLKVPSENDEICPLIGIRHQMAEKMTLSKQTIPHFSYFDRLDATALIQLKGRIQTEARSVGVRLTYMPFVLRALSLTLKEFPELNASIDAERGELILHKDHHIGIAAKTDEGLVVATLHSVQEMNLEAVIRSYDQLMKQVKEKRLTRQELTGSTITVSNFGPLGGRWATPIINPPEVSILGVAKISKEVVVHADEMAIRPMMNLSWSFDHRVIDGELAASASNKMISLLESPLKLT